MDEIIVVVGWIVVVPSLIWAFAMAVAAFMGFCTKDKEGKQHDNDA